MCKAIIGWVTDPEVEGTHNSRPVTCDEYIRALEQYLEAGDIRDRRFLRTARHELGVGKEKPRQGR